MHLDAFTLAGLAIALAVFIAALVYQPGRGILAAILAVVGLVMLFSVSGAFLGMPMVLAAAALLYWVYAERRRLRRHSG
jgi:hypothetical protein